MEEVKKKRNKNGRKRLAGQVVTLIALVALLAVVCVAIVILVKSGAGIHLGKSEETTVAETVTEEMTTEALFGGVTKAYVEEVLATASVTAAMYDYDGAIAYVTSNLEHYDEIDEASLFIAECEAKKAQLVKWPDNSQITHVFFHSLIENCDEAFSSSSRDNYNQVMTTIEEFNAIIEEMYERGYVMVSLHDIAEIDETTGQMTYKDIYLPSGKTPFVLSEDDVSYYDYMDQDGGFPDRLILTDDGRIMNEKDNDDGTSTIGAFDVVPLIDQFVEEHPDFSYHGSKGIVALTGYNGILGYRTSYIEYAPTEILETMKSALTEDVPDYPAETAWNLLLTCHTYDNPNILEDRETAKIVADAMKAEGWSFASHTWGHTNMGKVVDSSTGNVTAAWFYLDNRWWETEVESLIGETDTIIFAFGADIHTWRPYTDECGAYLYLKERGFNYFCNVDSSQYFVQISATAGGSGFLRQGRRNLDGQLMFKALMYPEQNLLSDLFDVLEVFDERRPLPVNGVTLPDWYDGTTLDKSKAGTVTTETTTTESQ